MKYWKIEMGNGFCGCDEQFLTTTGDDTELTFDDCLQMYSYADGAAGLNPDDEEFEEYSYEEYISENTNWEEIDEEEFQNLVDDSWEVR